MEYAVTYEGLTGRMFKGDNKYPSSRGPAQKLIFTHYLDAIDLVLYKAELRFDDSCGNGHCTFSMTGDGAGMAGCIHDKIAEWFPPLAKFAKWHLVSTDEPMHYVANTVYHASDRDCWGKRKGEPSCFDYGVTFGDNPMWHKIGKKFSNFLTENQAATNANGPKFDFEVIRYDHENRNGDTYKFAPKYTFGGFADKWHECPFDTEQEALDFHYALQNCNPLFVKRATAWSDGKERDFAAARSSACWPEATDEQLSVEPEELKRVLLERLPALQAEFKAAMEELGFDWNWPAGVRQPAKTA